MNAKKEPSRVARRCHSAGSKAASLAWVEPKASGASRRAWSRMSRIACQSSRVVARTRTMPHGCGGTVRRTTSFPAASAPAVVHAQPALGGHRDEDVVGAARVGRDEGVAALAAQVAAGQFEPFTRVALLDHGRALNGDVLVGRPLVLGAQAEPPGRLDGPGLAGAPAGAHVHRAARLVGVPDRDGQRAAAVTRGYAQHPNVHPGQELLALGLAHARRHLFSRQSVLSPVCPTKSAMPSMIRWRPNRKERDASWAAPYSAPAAAPTRTAVG